jgi:hypothetical protein
MRKNRLVLTLTLVITCTALPHPTLAQADARKEHGDWIRLTTLARDSASAWLAGRVIDLTATYLVIEPVGQGWLAIPRHDIARVQRHEGWDVRTKRATLVGLVAGLATGVTLAVATDCGPVCLATAPLGAGIGWRIGSKSVVWKWTDVRVSQIDPHLLHGACCIPRRTLGQAR